MNRAMPYERIVPEDFDYDPAEEQTEVMTHWHATAVYGIFRVTTEYKGQEAPAIESHPPGYAISYRVELKPHEGQSYYSGLVPVLTGSGFVNEGIELEEAHEAAAQLAVINMVDAVTPQFN